MGILEQLLDLIKQFLTEQKKTNELLEIIKRQNQPKNDFIIKGQKEASYILGISVPTLKKAIDEDKLSL